MRKIILFETSDEKQHINEWEARKYCDRKMGEILVKHARNLCQIDKFQDTLAYLEKHLDDVASAAAWKAEGEGPLEED